MKYKIPSIEEMLKAGVHFGHQLKRWNPKTAKYIYDADNKSHVIDLYQTEDLLKKAADFLYETAKSGGQIVFVGTKRQAKETVRELAEDCGALFVSERWLGGTLTNYDSVSKNWKNLDQLISDRATGKHDKYTKKEKLLLGREIAKLENLVGGIRNLSKKPAAVVIVDVKKEETAVKEAAFVGTPIVAILDTNGDPDLIDYPIPANDDAIKSIKILMETLASAVKEGYANVKKEKPEVVAKEESDKPKEVTRIRNKAEDKVIKKEDKKTVVKKAVKKEPVKKVAAKKAPKKEEKKPVKKKAVKKTAKKVTKKSKK